MASVCRTRFSLWSAALGEAPICGSHGTLRGSLGEPEPEVAEAGGDTSTGPCVLRPRAAGVCVMGCSGG